MSLSETLEMMEEAIDTDETFTNLDIYLAQIELDPELAIYNPVLSWVKKATVEQDIDSIYTGARAGNARARFLIHAAARNQVESGGDEICAFGPEHWLDDSLLNYEGHQPMPPSRQKVIAMLDQSIATIELTIEDVKNGFIDNTA